MCFDFSNESVILMDPKKHSFPPRHKEAHQISRRRVVYTKYIYDEIFFFPTKNCVAIIHFLTIAFANKNC